MESVVIGASGLVGSHIVRRFRDEGFNVTGTYHQTRTPEATVQVDKVDESAVSNVISANNPDIVIDAAAFHDVDACEVQREKAWAVNVSGTRNVAVAARQADAHLVYLSTDYVFPGDPESAPYAERDPVGPINFYGQCKYAGEQAATISGRSTVLRSSVVYGGSRPSFLTWALDELRENDEMHVVDDQAGTPTFAGDVAEACLQVGRESLTGLFHSAGPESISRYEFVRRLAAVIAGVWDTATVKPISTDELDQIADRPRDSSLDSAKLYDAIGVAFRDCETVFESCLNAESNAWLTETAEDC